MIIATLISDWSKEVLYESQIIGTLINFDPEIKIINLSKGIDSFDFLKSAFILKHSYKNYPNGTIHICLTENYSLFSQEFIVYKTFEQYFICRNNGFLNLLFDVLNDVYSFGFCDSKNEIDFVSKIFKEVVENKYLESAKLCTNVNYFMFQKPAQTGNMLIGTIIYIDSYGNCITNISKKEFDDFVEKKEFKIFIKSEKFSVPDISDDYNQKEEGDFVAIINSLDYLELAQNKGNLCEIMGLKIGSPIRVEIFEKQKEIQGRLFQ